MIRALETLVAIALGAAQVVAPSVAPATADGGAAVSADARTAPTAPKGHAANTVLAAANNEVVTVRDVLLEWRLQGRRSADPDRGALPSDDEAKAIAKQLVIERLWLAYGKAFPAWVEIVTPKLVEDEARDLYPTLWSDPKLPVDEHELMRTKAESSIAMQVALQSDPEFQRVSRARPSDVERFWELNPALHRVPTRLQLGRVVLGRALHGENLAAKAAELRQLAIEKGSLDLAAAELAKGDYSVLRIDDLENNQDLRDDVLAFARSAEPGELSAPIVGSESVMLFTVVAREPGREVTFEEAAAKLKLMIENGRREFRAKQFFVFSILPQSFFEPGDLFDDEVEQLVPGYKASRERANSSSRGK